MSLSGKTVTCPNMTLKILSTTCSRSALRSRRYSSSISSNCLTTTSNWVIKAHSALYKRSVIRVLTPSASMVSSSSIKCTSKTAMSSGGVSLRGAFEMFFCKRLSSSATVSRALATLAISDSTWQGSIK